MMLWGEWLADDEQYHRSNDGAPSHRIKSAFRRLPDYPKKLSSMRSSPFRRGAQSERVLRLGIARRSEWAETLICGDTF